MTSAPQDAKPASSEPAKLAIHADGSMEAEASAVIIPMQDLQHAHTSTLDDNVITDTSAVPTVPTPDLPPIDKRGFLTLLAQHVSRCVYFKLKSHTSSCTLYADYTETQQFLERTKL
jgi:hypothetical protein